uniref:Nose resistant-to-fluoxetine protein N-terminal domain-containing protein n=1 Tax=Anopheles gambiae TaxID=7165 RepID=A0A1S4GGM9_ANOGA
MVTVPIRIGRLRERRISVLARWSGVLLLLHLATGDEDAARLSPFPGRHIGVPDHGGPAYATYHTQSAPSEVVELTGTHRHGSAAATLDQRLDPNQADLVLPNYETSSVRSAAGLPPVYKYTDNVFRVPKRKAKTSHPEPMPRKSHSNRSVGTGRVPQHQGADAAWSSSSTAAVAYAPGSAAALVGNHRPAVRWLSEESTLFQLFTGLFDHSNWNILELKARVSEQCAAHVGLYLRDLRRQRGWALKASDSSGRYGGQYFFGNEFWMGSLTFCDEVNRVLRLTPMPPGARQLEMRFFVAKISVQLEALLSTQSSSILLGQCLPKSCTIDDISELLRSDPMLSLLNNSTLNVVATGGTAVSALTIAHVRPVPGSYNLWSDPKVFALFTVLTVMGAVIVYASCGTGVDGKPKAARYSKKAHGPPLGAEGNHHIKRERGDGGGRMGDALEMHKINVESNNNVAGGIGQQAPAAADGVLYKDRKGTRFSLHDILACFDVGPNAASILSVERANEDSLTCVHGLRLYSLLWTVLVHTYLQLFAVSENRFGRKIAERSFLYQLVGNASFSVDTFFFISGLLIVYLYLKSVSKSGQPTTGKQAEERTSPAAAAGTGTREPSTGGAHRDATLGGATRKAGLSILYRYLRLTPVYWFTIVTNEIILKWTYDRSVFTPGIIDHITCDRFWWRNILYVNNWFPFTEMCMIWSWYLANDMQFYVIAIVLLMISSRNFRLAAGLLFLCLGGSWLLSIYFSLHYRYTYKVADPFESFDILYDKPWQRIGPYIVGMITGYILHRRPNAPRIVPPLRLLLWTISTGTLIALIFGVWNGELSVHWTAWYVSVGHTGWGQRYGRDGRGRVDHHPQQKKAKPNRSEVVWNGI